MRLEQVKEDIVLWLQERVGEAGAKGVIFGLSGGIDSAVVAALAKEAFGNQVLGLIMPCHSQEEDEIHANILAEALGIPTQKVDLSQTFDTLLAHCNITSDSSLAKANIKPRLRMTTLYYYAQTYGYLVCGTSNKSEWTVGYYTKYGDSGADLLPIADLVKHEVRDLAKILKVPEIIIEKPPSAGLWKGQTDEEEMGFGYDMLDAYIEGKEVPASIGQRIEEMHRKTAHKRRFAYQFEKK